MLTLHGDGCQAPLWVAGWTAGKAETRGGRADVCRIQMTILDRFRGFFGLLICTWLDA